MIYIIWFMCVWTMIVIGGDVIMHNNIHTQVYIQPNQIYNKLTLVLNINALAHEGIIQHND